MVKVKRHTSSAAQAKTTVVLTDKVITAGKRDKERRKPQKAYE